MGIYKTRVKTIYALNKDYLDTQLNEFLEKIDSDLIIDIKLSVVNECTNQPNNELYAMVIYKE